MNTDAELLASLIKRYETCGTGPGCESCRLKIADVAIAAMPKLLAELDKLRVVAKAALRSRRAYFQAIQNEGEVANGGRDFGQPALDAEAELSVEAFDVALDAFGPAWDLGVLDEVFARISK